MTWWNGSGGIKPDLDDQLVSFSTLDTVGLVIWPVKIVPETTYNVLNGTLSLCTSTSLSIIKFSFASYNICTKSINYFVIALNLLPCAVVVSLIRYFHI